MAKRGTTVLFVLLLATVAGPVSGTLRDGLPRPDGYPDVPTEAYGPTPPCLDANGVQVTCEWYGFSHELYPAQGAECNSVMREYLSNTTLFSPGQLTPYMYYLNKHFVFDPATNASYCLYGCFDMSNSAAAPPPSVLAPSPLESSSPSPAGLAPSPLDFSLPPPAVLGPSPLGLSSPPPAVLSPPPEFSPPPPATLFTPPPAVSTPPIPPVATPTSPPVATQPVASPPDAVQVNLNGAECLRPLGFLSIVLSAALLSLIGLTSF